MNDGVEGKYLNMLVYKNLKTGETVEYEGSSQEYVNSKIWEKTTTWKYDTMISKEVIPTRLPSISTQFNPTISVSEIGKNEMQLDFIQKMLSTKKVKGVELFDIEKDTRIQVVEKEYLENYSDTSFYRFEKDIMVVEEPMSEISIREYILKAPTIFIMFSKELKKAKIDDLQNIQSIEKSLKKAKIPFVLITNEQRPYIKYWLKKNGLNLPAFTNDATELKAVSRSNPSLMIVKQGVVKGKYPNKSIPSFDWIKKHILN
jgi:hypothetical protein